MKEIVIATRNPGKLEEFKVLMKDLEVELRSLEEWPNVPEPEDRENFYGQCPTEGCLLC